MSLPFADAVLDPCALAVAHLQGGDVLTVLVGDEAGVPIAVLVKDRELRAGMRPFATGDQPSALRPWRQVQTVGELGNPRPVPKLAVAVNRPHPLGLLSFEDLLADRLIDGVADREADPGVVAVRRERMRAATDISADQHVPREVVPRQLAQREFKDLEVILGGV